MCLAEVSFLLGAAGFWRSLLALLVDASRLGSVTGSFSCSAWTDSSQYGEADRVTETLFRCPTFEGRLADLLVLPVVGLATKRRRFECAAEPWEGISLCLATAVEVRLRGGPVMRVIFLSDPARGVGQSFSSSEEGISKSPRPLSDFSALFLYVACDFLGVVR